MISLLSIRILSATIGALYLILITYLGGWYFNISVLLMMFIGLYEIYNALDKTALHPFKILGYLFAILSIPIFLFKGIAGVFAIFTVLCLASLTLIIIGKRYLDVLSTIFSMIYPVLLFLFLVVVKSITPSSIGIIALAIIFICTWATDSLAYFVGTNMGKHKLSPVISPKKTTEGAIGGLIASCITGLLFSIVLPLFNMKIEIYWFHYLILGLLCGIFSQLGDLSASAFKRYCQIKDFSNLFPGHGGLLDRFDSILFTAPIIYCYFILFLKT